MQLGLAFPELLDDAQHAVEPAKTATGATGTPLPLSSAIAATAAALRPAEGFWGAIRKSFGLMEIAEEEIAAGEAAHPEHAALIHDSFLLYKPGMYPFDHHIDTIYRSHCRELIGRIMGGGRMETPTDAELLVGVTSFFAHVTPGVRAVGIAMVLFKSVVSSVGADGPGIRTVLELATDYTASPREEWEGQWRDLLDQLRKSSAVQRMDRKEDWKSILSRNEGTRWPIRNRNDESTSFTG